MKKLLIFLSALLAVVPVIVIGCTKNVESTRSSVDSVRDFYQNGVHITISDGCPMTTKYSSFDGALTITGEDGDISYTLYAVEINEDNNFSSYDVFSESGTKIGTYVYCNNILVNFEISADLDSPQNTVTTKAKEEGEKYSDCVKREAKNMNDRLDNDPVNSAICDFLPCHAITLLVAIIECAN